MQLESASIHNAYVGGDRLITVILGARFSGVGIHKVLYRSGPCL